MTPAVLLLVADPAGDVRGNGEYVLPSALGAGLERSLDLRELRAENVDGRLRLVIGLGGTDNPWDSPAGFSAPLLDIFVKTDFGGEKALGDTGLNAPAGSGWQHHFRVSGFGARSWSLSPSGEKIEHPQAPRVRLEGSSVVLETELPAGRYGYWVTSRVYSPLTPGGYLTPRVGGDATSLSVNRAGMPSPVDVLLATDQAPVYRDRVLPSSGELKDRRPLSLLVLAGVGLIVAVLATLRAWRKEP